MNPERVTITSGAPWEATVGYARAVRIGQIVEVAGTAAADAEGRVVGRGDAYEQARFILDKIERALQAAGASMEDVIRTRIYLTDISRWQEVARAHSEVFAQIRPVTTAVQVSALIDPEMLVEIEASAVVGAEG